MAAPSVLFLGGTGVISWACTREALAAGFAVTVLGRGISTTRPSPEGCELLTADLDDDSFGPAVAGGFFDVVVDFRAFTPAQVADRLATLGDRFGQYVFISSASAYQKPPARVPVLESSPLRNPFSQYARDKTACEELLTSAYRDRGTPVTVVRPSHTYDHTAPPFDGGWTVVERMRRGAPVVVHGDGTSLWTLTHHTDFARAFTGLLGLPAAVGETVHITSDEWLSWDAIHETMAAAAGVEPHLVHVTTDDLVADDPGAEAPLRGDKSHSMVFDNTKVKTLVPGWQARVPFWRGAAEMVEWFDADPARRRVDSDVDVRIDRLVARHGTRRAD